VAVTYVRYAVERWGVGELCVDGARVLWHDLPRPAASRRSGPHPHRGEPSAPTKTIRPTSPRVCDEFASTLIARLRAYFAGAGDTFSDVVLHLDGLAPFERACAEALRRVPRGSTVTYGELAGLAGSPRAARAAGTFCARNRFGVFVPCHRVVSANGLGGYGSLGAAYKRRLLALEHASV
jgi:O-6-methylguanine DNA methyltransferase